MQSTVDRFAWPVVLALLVFAVVTVAGGIYQSQRVQDDYAQRDRTLARSTAAFVASYVDRRLAEQDGFITANADLVRNASEPALARDVQRRYLDTAPGYVLGVVVTRDDGSAVFVLERHPGTLGVEATFDDITAVARSAAGTGRPVVSGRIDVGGVDAYAHASPLAGVSDRYGAWVVVYDLAQSPLGSFFLDGRAGRRTIGATIVDDRGRHVLGPRRDHARSSTIHERVQGTPWQIAVPRSTVPRSIPQWTYVLVLVAMLLLGAVYVLQEGTRRTLRSEAEVAAGHVERLYSFAREMLNARSPREQAGHLARAVQAAVGAEAVRARIARDRDDGLIAGQALSGAYQYRLGIRAPRETIGELVVYTTGTRLDDEQRAVVQTMSAMAGAAMHTLMVLERERSHATELRRLDELRTNLLSTVAHELRSPLTAVKGVLSLLSMQDDLSAKQHEYVRVATERTDSLVALIQDLFDCSLMESGQLDIRPERRRATELLEGSLGALATSRPDDIYLSATPNLMMTADPLRFDQIVNNLVTNSLRHGRPPIEVVVRPYRDGACLVVTDNGPGIPLDERDRIFSKFYQTDSGSSRLVEGAGLGLSLVLGLVDLHGGTIEVDSARVDGTGARFTIFFPDVSPLHGDATDDGPEPEDELAPLRSII